MLARSYLRASTDEQDATRARREVVAFAAERGLVIAGTYVENESGAKLARPELFRLLADSRPGDVLLIDESKIEPKDGHIFALQSESKGTIVKRLVKSDFDGWIIRSDNPLYRDETLRDGEINEVRIIGRVVWRGGML